MKLPPLGYDDETIVPSVRMRFTIDRLSHEFKKIETVFLQTEAQQFTSHANFDQDFRNLLEAGSELKHEHLQCVQKLIDDYAFFTTSPSQEHLEQLFNDLKNLELLLHD